MQALRRTIAALAAATAVFCASAAPSGEVAVVCRNDGYYLSLGRHLSRWLAGEGIECPPVPDSSLPQALAKAKMAFLVGFDEPTGEEMKVLSAYRSRGGRLTVFYSSSPKLAALMGVKPLGWAKAAYPGQWSRMEFLSVADPAGCPKSILQTSTVLQRAVPAKGSGARVVATWRDRKGKDCGDAAWIAGPAGYWMTHVLLADGDEDEKARLVAAIAASAAPDLWSFQAWKKKRAADDAFWRDLASRQSPRPGEIHAVWEHSGCGLYPGDWPKTMKVLAGSGVTDLFVNVAGFGFAHYPSSVLPRSRTFEQEGDQLKACLDAAKGTGVRVHAWMLCFTATRGSKEALEDFRRKGWRLSTKEGVLTEYVDPSNAAVRKKILDAIVEIQAKYPVDGIHLDFVRWYERAAKPQDAAETISKFVSSARLRVPRPKWLTAAVLGKYPACVASVGQDWTGWVDSNIVDYVVPMDYTENLSKFDGYLAQHAETKTRARKTIVGIGVTANESRLDAQGVINQIRLARRRNLAGVALFDLDRTLEKRILPYLSTGMW